jgi:acyl-CoA reductase-like NAD-dependent aldehyde dehydrogenase
VQAQGGAKNPIILLPDADVALTTSIVTDSAFGNAGQRCLAASLAITVADADKIFVPALAEAAASRVVGNGLEQGVHMGPVISPQSKARIEGLDPARVGRGRRAGGGRAQSVDQGLRRWLLPAPDAHQRHPGGRHDCQDRTCLGRCWA